MDADIAFKVLFRTRPKDLLGLTGDQGARVLSTQVPEVQQRVRRPDFVLTLQRRGQVYLRHLEFQDHLRRGLVDLGVMRKAAKRIRAEVPEEQRADLLSTLCVLSRTGGPGPG